MTNYRHAQMINIISKMNSPVLAVNHERCVLVRNRNAECLRCAAVCTTGAIALSDEGVEVRPELCIGCGTCASACPTCCLEALNPADDKLFASVAEAVRSSGGVAVACEQACARWGLSAGETGVAPLRGRDVPVVGVVCLGRVDESLVIESAARGAREFVLVGGTCNSCRHATGGAFSEELCASACVLAQAVGASITTERVSAADFGEMGQLGRLEELGRSEELNRGGDRGGEPCGERTTSQIVANEAEAPAVQFAHVQADGTLAHHVPQRRLRLYNSLKRLMAAAEEKPGAVRCVDTRLWGHVSIDTDCCRSCRMCTVFCPTGALSRFDEPDGTFGIDHRQALCAQCRLCEAICPEHAITVDSQVELEAFLSGAVEHFELKPVGWKPGAPDAIATRMARLMKTDTYQDPQAGMKPQGIAEQRCYWNEREQQRRDARQMQGEQEGR